MTSYIYELHKHCKMIKYIRIIISDWWDTDEDSNMNLRTNRLKATLFGAFWMSDGRAFQSHIAWRVNGLETKRVSDLCE